MHCTFFITPTRISPFNSSKNSSEVHEIPSGTFPQIPPKFIHWYIQECFDISFENFCKKSPREIYLQWFLFELFHHLLQDSILQSFHQTFPKIPRTNFQEFLQRFHLELSRNSTNFFWTSAVSSIPVENTGWHFVLT